MNARIPDAVILAAGFGSRLLDAKQDLPKALVPVCGRPLLEYTLRGLADAGVRRAVVVVGHRGEQIEAALAELGGLGLTTEIVRNPNYELPNGSSLAAARAAVAQRPFLLLMADHLMSEAAIARLLAAPPGFAVGVDYLPQPPERLVDVTRVRVRADGSVEAFGKQLERWDAVDAGIFACEPEVFDVIDALGPASEVGAIMTVVAARSRFQAVDLAGAFWLDVDTPADLAAAERLLSERAAAG